MDSHSLEGPRFDDMHEQLPQGKCNRRDERMDRWKDDGWMKPLGSQGTAFPQHSTDLIHSHPAAARDTSVQVTAAQECLEMIEENRMIPNASRTTGNGEDEKGWMEDLRIGIEQKRSNHAESSSSRTPLRLRHSVSSKNQTTERLSLRREGCPRPLIWSQRPFSNFPFPFPLENRLQAWVGNSDHPINHPKDRNLT